MGQITIPNRPQGSATRVIAAILADFDAILAQANGNLEAEENVKVGVAAATLDGNANAEGASSALARADHKHLIQGVEQRAANPVSGHFVGRVYFNTVTLRLMVCTDAATPVYVPVPSGPSWVRAGRSTSQAIPHATETALALNSETWDTEAIHDSVTNNSRLTCKTAGVYSIHAGIVFTSNGTGIRQVLIRVNGVSNLAHLAVPAVAGSNTNLSVSTLYQLAVNDYVECFVRQTSGGDLDVINSQSESPIFTMARIA